MSTQPETTEGPLPTIRVVRGEASAEEIAALSVMFAALSGGESTEAGSRGGWSHRRRTFNPGARLGSGWGGPS